MDAAAVESGLARYADLLQRLPGLHDGLRSAADVGELLARGTALACRECGFARGVVVGVREGRLHADASGILADPASDALRRRMIAAPVQVAPGSLEAELVRRPDASSAPTADRPSALASALELETPAYGVIAPEGTTVGLLVLDRPELGEPSDAERVIVAIFGRMLAVVLEHVVLRQRIAELSRELRAMTVSAQALAAEAFEGPVTFPVHGRHLPSFRTFADPGTYRREGPKGTLTDRETVIASLMAEGRSNPEIAEQLFLSSETIKDHVARIMRKLGAANRVEAAVTFLRLDQAPPD